MQPLRPLFSICIPAYKRPENIERLLQSIESQTFTSYEIIITDDSPDNVLHSVLQKYRHLPISYYKNEAPLGTPANWNFCISKSNGEWIKLMHDDDCFATNHALQKFKTAIDTHMNACFFFCAYVNVHEGTLKREIVRLNAFRWLVAKQNYASLLANNLVGPPSVTLHKNKEAFQYDPNFKWVVDMDFYIRWFQKSNPVYINSVLVEVGINAMQVTNYTFGKAEVQLKENLYLLHKIGYGHLKNIIVFDAWWRMLRNFKIKETKQLKETGYKETVPPVLEQIIQFQNKISQSLLRKGIYSKINMLICYLSTFILFRKNTD